MSTQKLGTKPFERLFDEDDLGLLVAPTKLFHPYRMLLMNTLKLHGNVEFRQLKYNIPQITDGNLATHLRVLERLGYIHCHKDVVNRKLRTSYEITAKGRKAFEHLINALKRMIKHGEKI